MELLKVKDLCKSYGKGEIKVDALKSIKFNYKSRRICGYSWSFRFWKEYITSSFRGVDRPSSGKIILEGTDIYSLKENELAILRRRKIGFIFQFYNLIPVLTAEENIEMPVLLDNKKPDKKYMGELLDILGLRERKNHLPAQLSGGQQQRVSIGRALANKPSIIFADEPTGNLDSKNSKEIMELLRYSVKKYNQTLVLITHDLNIAKMADRVITIADGEVKGDEVNKVEKL